LPDSETGDVQQGQPYGNTRLIPSFLHILDFPGTYEQPENNGEINAELLESPYKPGGNPTQE